MTGWRLTVLSRRRQVARSSTRSSAESSELDSANATISDFQAAIASLKDQQEAELGRLGGWCHLGDGVHDGRNHQIIAKLEENWHSSASRCAAARTTWPPSGHNVHAFAHRFMRGITALPS